MPKGRGPTESDAVRKRTLRSLACILAGANLTPTTAQADALGAEVLLLTAHVSDETIQLGEQYRRKLSSNGRYVLTPGVEIYYEKPITPGFWRVDSVRYTLAGYSDSIDHKSGYLGITPRWEHPLRERLTLSIGLGPVLIFRETWNTVPGSRDDGYCQESDRFLKGYQYKLIVGAELDLQYQLTPRMQGVWSIIPGIPYVITKSIADSRPLAAVTKNLQTFYTNFPGVEWCL